MEKKNVVFLTVLAVATLLTAVVGTTFAYFTATVNNTTTPSATTITTASNLSVDYSDGAQITGTTIVPGWSSVEKTITVTNNSSVAVNYQISWTNVANTFSKGASETTDDLVYSLTKNGANVIGTSGYATSATTGVLSAGYTDITGKAYSLTSGKVTLDGTTEIAVAAAPAAGATGSQAILVPSTQLAAGATDTYVLRVYFVETGIAQTENQSSTSNTVSFSSTLEASVLNVTAG